jgi:Tfp pilus assembly protein PilO
MTRSNSKSPAQRVRIILGVLLGLNLVAAGLVLYPPGGSAETLEQQRVTLQSQVAQRRTMVGSTRQHAAAIEKGRTDGDRFLSQYFLGRRAAYATVLTELGEAARKTHLKERETAFANEPVEGSADLSMMTVTANYEGTYQDLMGFVAEVDRSPLLLIIESLNAAPQTGSKTLSVSLKIEAFVREEPVGGAPVPAGPIAQATPEAPR